MPGASENHLRQSPRRSWCPPCLGRGLRGCQERAVTPPARVALRARAPDLGPKALEGESAGVALGAGVVQGASGHDVLGAGVVQGASASGAGGMQTASRRGTRRGDMQAATVTIVLGAVGAVGCAGGHELAR